MDNIKQQLAYIEAEMINENISLSLVKNFKIQILKKLPSTWIILLYILLYIPQEYYIMNGILLNT